MVNRPKQKGTSFETAVARYMRERLGDDRIERRALHGSKDLGDLHGIYAHGFEGIAECKSYAGTGWNQPANLRRWREETLDERGNADANFALLIVKVPGKGDTRMGETIVHLTLGDLAAIARGVVVDTKAADAWVQMTLAECCDLIQGDADDRL